MDISDYFKLIGYDKIISYLRSAVDFYIKPKLFFKKFFEKSDIEKVRQVFFYLVIETIVIFILIETESLTHIAKNVLVYVILVFPLYLILTISQYITKKITKLGNSKSKDIFFFILLCKILFLPFFIVSLELFLNIEYYEFYFAYNCIFVLLIYSIFILSAFLFYTKIRYILVVI